LLTDIWVGPGTVVPGTFNVPSGCEVGHPAAKDAGSIERSGDGSFASLRMTTRMTTQHPCSRRLTRCKTVLPSQDDDPRRAQLGTAGKCFTEVEEFGGGFIPDLNTLSGTPVPAPECLSLEPDDFVPPGATYTDEVEGATKLYQCCIHPGCAPW